MRTFDVGNYGYASLAKTWKHGTRVGFGAYDFTQDVVARGNRAGGQFTLEQTIGKRVTLAAEWYTGKTSVGYVNPGAILETDFEALFVYGVSDWKFWRDERESSVFWELGYNFN